MGTKLDNNEFDKRLKEKFGNEYIRLSNYKNLNSKILIKHNSTECNYHTWYVRAGNMICKFPKGGCPICGKNKQVKGQIKITPEVILQRIKDKYKDEYIILENIKGLRDKIKFKHTECNTIFIKSPFDLLRLKNPCPECDKKKRSKNIKKLTEKEYLKRIPKEFEPIDNFIDYDTKILHRHLCETCNNSTFYQSPHNILNGIGCPNCKAINIKNLKTKTEEEFKKEAFKIFGNEYTIIGKYVNNKTKIKIRHNKCGRILELEPHNFLQKKAGCNYCVGHARLTQKEFDERVYNKTKGEYSVVGKYVNMKTKIEFRHNKCNNTFFTAPNTFLDDKVSCPYCKASIAENKIINFLEENNISYKYQDDSFQDCKYKKVLPFDFRIINEDSFILLEYDGEQHYKPIYGEDRLKLQQKRDQIKTNYCKKNNIKLYRIPYTDFNNIENKLNEILVENKII